MKATQIHRAKFVARVTPTPVIDSAVTSRSIDVIASTPAVDGCGRIVIQDWNLARYQANPVVLWNHGCGGSLFGSASDDSTMPIGYATNVRVDGEELRATLNFVDEKANPIAEKVYQGFLQGSLRAVSVGWDSSEAEYDAPTDTLILRGNELLEISAVAIPANAEAVKAEAAYFASFFAGAKPQQKDTNMNSAKEAREPTEGAASALPMLLAAIGAASSEQAAGMIAGYKAKAEKYDELKTKVDALESAQTQAHVASIVDEAKRAGKFTPANEAKYLEVCSPNGVVNVATLKALVETLPVVVNQALAKTEAKGATASLTSREKKRAASLGFTEEKYAAQKLELSKRHEVAGEGDE